jgi:hypothetical protein
MLTRLRLLMLATLLITPSINVAELTIPSDSDVSHQIMPNRGLSMAAVLGRFGEPNQRFGPIGQPPISEWVYGSFRVYFEYRTVLHSIDLNTLTLPSLLPTR